MLEMAACMRHGEISDGQRLADAEFIRRLHDNDASDE
jgi:hypothetical protein